MRTSVLQVIKHFMIGLVSDCMTKFLSWDPSLDILIAPPFDVPRPELHPSTCIHALSI